MNRIDLLDSYLTLQTRLDFLVDQAKHGRTSWTRDVDHRAILREKMGLLKARWVLQSDDDETEFYRELKRREAEVSA